MLYDACRKAGESHMLRNSDVVRCVNIGAQCDLRARDKEVFGDMRDRVYS